MLIRLCKYVPCSKHSIVFLCYFVHIRCIFRKISSLQADEYKTRWLPFRTAWVRSANQITRLDNKEIQNINKRPQWVLDEGGPLSNHDDDGNKNICIFDKDKQYLCTLCTCIFHLLTFGRRSRSFYDVKWPVLQLCGRREHMMTNVQFCLLISQALVPISRVVTTHFSSIMSLNNWKMIAETRSHIFRWRSRFRRRRVCLSSLLYSTKHFKC